MVDMILCDNKKCPRKNDCYRFMAIPSMVQPYATLPCIDKNCKYDFFIEIGDKRIRSEYINENAPEPIPRA